MKQIVYFLFLGFALSLIACDDRIDDSRKSDFHGDTLASIAWNYPLIMEHHFGTDRFNEGLTRRVPVVPRSWSGKWSGLYVIDPEIKGVYGRKADTCLLMEVIVRGDTIDRRKKEFDDYDKISIRMTNETHVGTTPVLCGVDRLEAIGTHRETGDEEVVGGWLQLRLRRTLSEGSYQSSENKVRWVACESSSEVSRSYLTQVGRLNPHTEAGELEPRIKIYVPLRICRAYSRMRVGLLLVNRQKLVFEIRTPDPSTLTPEGFKVYRKELMSKEDVLL